MILKVGGILTADFLSGMVHWAADSYGSVDMYLIGKNLLRNFREHHIDPTAITRHDFVETNGDNFAVIVPALGYIAYKFVYNSVEQIMLDYNWLMFLFLLSVFVTMTNQVKFVGNPSNLVPQRLILFSSTNGRTHILACHAT